METTNGDLIDSNGRNGPKTEGKDDDDDDKCWLMLHGSSRGLTSSEGLRHYKRRKRIKMSNSDVITNTNFYDKIKAADDSASNQSAQRLCFDEFPIGPGECSLRNCSKIVLQQMHQSHNHIRMSHPSPVVTNIQADTIVEDEENVNLNVKDLIEEDDDNDVVFGANSEMETGNIESEAVFAPLDLDDPSDDNENDDHLMTIKQHKALIRKLNVVIKQNDTLVKPVVKEDGVEFKKFKKELGSLFKEEVQKISEETTTFKMDMIKLVTDFKDDLNKVDGLGGCIQNAVVPYPERCCTSVVKESLNNVERSDNQTHCSAEEVSHKQSEGCTNSELCVRAFSDILTSDKFSELCSLLVKNFGVVNVNRVLDVDAINMKMKNGAYETSPMLYVKDIQQVWTKLLQVSNEMATLAESLSDKSRAHYEQFVKKPKAADGCQGCGKKADVRNCLVCDSCEDIYHLSCTEVIGSETPPKSWYCASCVSNGIGSPHDNCLVSEKLKAAASISHVNGVPTNDQSQDVPDGLEADVTEESPGSRICFICKSEVNTGDSFRTCGHSSCSHKFYHIKCLTSKQLGVCGPCWYCPSCMCRRCLVDKDGDQIVLCNGCDQAYHIYCTLQQLNSIPEGSWFCGKCDREVKRISIMKRVYENMQKKVKAEEDVSGAVMDERKGLDMLVTAAKTVSHQDTNDTFRNII